MSHPQTSSATPVVQHPPATVHPLWGGRIKDAYIKAVDLFSRYTVIRSTFHNISLKLVRSEHKPHELDGLWAKKKHIKKELRGALEDFLLANRSYSRVLDKHYVYLKFGGSNNESMDTTNQRQNRPEWVEQAKLEADRWMREDEDGWIKEYSV